MARIRLPMPYSMGSFSKAFIIINTKGDINDLQIQKVFSPKIENFGEQLFTDLEYRKKLFSTFEKLFKEEKRILSNIKHPNIIEYLDSLSGPVENYVMEFGGITIQELALNGEFTEEDIIKFILDISSAISYLQKNKLVHLDIAPRNIFFSIETKSFKLGDFGMARTLTDEKNRRSFDSFSAPNSKESPPEYIKGKVYSEKSDIYMFGYTLLYIISKGKIGTYQKRLYEVLELVKYDIDKILDSLPTTIPNIDLFKELLKMMLKESPEERGTIKEIQKYLDENTQNFTYNKKFVGISEQSSYNVLDYNLYGFLDKIKEVFSKNIKEISNIHEFMPGLLLSKFQNYFPNYKLSYYYFIKVFVADHLKSPNSIPNDDQRKSFVKLLQLITKEMNQTYANFLIYFLYFEISQINQEKEYTGKFSFYLNEISKITSQYVQQNGFVMQGIREFDANKGIIKNSLLPIFNSPSINCQLHYLSIEDYNSFNFHKSIHVLDVIKQDDENFDIQLKKDCELEDSFVLIPEYIAEINMHYKVLTNPKLTIGFISSINNVINHSQKISFTLKLVSTTQMLSTTFKTKITLQKSNSFCEVVSTDIDLNDGQYVTTDIFKRLIKL